MNKLIPLFERLLSLLVVFLLLAGTVVWSGKLFGRRIGNAAEGEALKTCVAPPDDAQRLQLGIADAILQAADSAAWTVRTADGNELGIVVSTAPYAKDVMGFAGNTPIYMYIDNAGIVKAAAAADNEESPDFFKKAATGIFAQISGQTSADVAATRIDAVTGATFSSNALISNIKYTLSARTRGKQTVKAAPVIGWGRTVLVAGVLVLGIVAARRWRGIKWVRLVILALNVGVTGFWCGQFLSLAMVRGWIQNGVDPLLYLPGVLILLVAIVMPYLGRPHHYCQWVCPYGSLQELAWHLPVPKLHLKPQAYKAMRVFRMTVLMVLLIALWLGVGVGVLDYEPFAAFVLGTATPAVLVLAALFVVAGVFVPHPWCRCICPIGTLLELSEDSGRKPRKVPTGKA